MNEESPRNSSNSEEGFDFFENNPCEKNASRAQGVSAISEEAPKEEILYFSSESNQEEEPSEEDQYENDPSRKILTVGINKIREVKEKRKQEALEMKKKGINDRPAENANESQPKKQEKTQNVRTQMLKLDTDEYNRQIQMFLFFTVSGHGGILNGIISDESSAVILSLIPESVLAKGPPKNAEELLSMYLESFGPLEPEMQKLERKLTVLLQLKSGESLNLFQHQFLFIGFAKIWGFRARLVEIIDLRSYYLGDMTQVFYKEFKKTSIKGIKMKKESNEGSRNEKKRASNDRGISSFVEEQVLAAANAIINEEIDGEAIKEAKKEKKERQKKDIERMDEFLNDFKFDSKKKASKVSGITMGKMIEEKDEKKNEVPLVLKSKEAKNEKKNKEFLMEEEKKDKVEEVKNLPTDSVKYWIEIYEEDRFKVVDLLSGKIFAEENDIISFVKPKLHQMPSLFVIGLGWASEERQAQDSSIKMTQIEGNESSFVYLKDLTTRYVFEQWVKMLIARRKTNLAYFLRDYTILFFSFEKKAKTGRVAPQDLVINQMDQDFLTNKERSLIPTKPYEFTVHPQFILQSSLGKYGWIKPGAQPVETDPAQFNLPDVVYLRKDTARLCSKLQWRMRGRSVKQGETPVKSVKGMGVSAETKEAKMTELFGEWQTEEFVAKLNEDGTIPINEYGNYEVFSCPLPPGTVYIALKGVERALKDEKDVDFVPAVTGFEKGANGRSHAIVFGIVAHQRDEELIKQKYKGMEEEIERKEKEREGKKCIEDWREIFKQLIKSKTRTIQNIMLNN